jgi:hypothetical protein
MSGVRRQKLQMGPDERATREVQHSTWIDAVNAGDLVCLGVATMLGSVVLQIVRRAGHSPSPEIRLKETPDDTR